ncbi:histidine ammonia-lyase [Dongia mobilis]|uniref:Histidine ammonia-lyase n=1 Tax=Dongia mobilis TaxID=578943 RepID=A0A4R6WJF6_9PROT|nr:aromatic amino acid lyase [Dongia mobilis]TDQ80505.1 histidine ammonia-lyase [Dongia mobilis]
MLLTLDTRADLTLDIFRQVAWEGAAIRFSDGAMARMRAARAAFMKLIEDPDLVIYGVTSGYGQNARLRLDGAARRTHARTPPYPCTAPFGRPAPDRVARGIVLARLANFIDGHAAVTPELAVEVADLLQGGRLPEVSLEGQGGAGEILWLGPLIIAVAERFPLAEKDALSLINGAPAASALIADAAIAMRRRLDLAERVLALSAEAILAPLEAYDPALEALWDDAHEAVALQRMRHLLEGGAPARRPYQAPVSYRILPRVLGQFRRVIAAAEEIAASSLRSVTDNPVFLPPDAGAPDPAHPFGRVLSNGGYHNARAYPALDNLAAAAADLCAIAERHTTKLLDGRYSLLPDQLQSDSGQQGYLGILGFVQVGYAEQARRAAQRTFLPGSEGGGFGQNDVAPLTGLAWMAQEEAGRCLEAALAMLGAVASQALHVTARQAPPALADLLADIRAAFPPLDAPRRYGPGLAALAEAFRADIYGAMPSA